MRKKDFRLYETVKIVEIYVNVHDENIGLHIRVSGEMDYGGRHVRGKREIYQRGRDMSFK